MEEPSTIKLEPNSSGKMFRKIPMLSSGFDEERNFSAPDLRRCAQWGGIL